MKLQVWAFVHGPYPPCGDSSPVHTMDNNRRFMDDEGGCEVYSLYMAGIPEILIHPHLSKLSPGGWCGQVYKTAEGDVNFISQEVLKKLLAMVRLLPSFFTSSFICLFSSPCLFRSLLLGRWSEDSLNWNFKLYSLYTRMEVQRNCVSEKYNLEKKST